VHNRRLLFTEKAIEAAEQLLTQPALMNQKEIESVNANTR
jgi:hypothetical protein